MRTEIISAYRQACEGFSIDRVIADPVLNNRFIEACRSIDIGFSASDLNRKLLNLRKRGQTQSGQRSRKTTFSDIDEYLFASEIAIRFLERRDGLTLDDIICDPDRALEFDEIARGLAPGFSSLQYRWAALSLRKNKKLKPEILSRVVPSISVVLLAALNLDMMQIPLAQGLYVFVAPPEVLYVGETDNLRGRLKKHLDHSDNRSLAKWLWEYGPEKLRLELHELPTATATKVRKALEAEMIRSRRPVFNIQRV